MNYGVRYRWATFMARLVYVVERRPPLFLTMAAICDASQKHP